MSDIILQLFLMVYDTYQNGGDNQRLVLQGVFNLLLNFCVVFGNVYVTSWCPYSNLKNRYLCRECFGQGLTMKC